MSLEQQVAKVPTGAGMAVITSGGVIIAGKLQAFANGVAVLTNASITQPGSLNAYAARIMTVDVGSVVAVWQN